MVRVAMAVLVILSVMLSSCLAAAPAPEARPEAPRSHLDRLKPLLMETDDLRTVGKGEKPGDAAKAGPAIHVDAKTGAVRIPVTPTQTRGVVERLLSARGKHRAASVLVTSCSAAEVAAALAKAGLQAGTRPVPVGDDRARPPSGPAVEMTLLATSSGGKVTRIPAARLLASKSDGTPVGSGRWVHVGPQTIGDKTDRVLVTELSGSVATTDLRDLSAIIYWVPRTEDPQVYARACYASREPLPQTGAAFELEIRPATTGKPAP